MLTVLCCKACRAQRPRRGGDAAAWPHGRVAPQRRGLAAGHAPAAAGVPAARDARSGDAARAGTAADGLRRARLPSSIP